MGVPRSVLGLVGDLSVNRQGVQLGQRLTTSPTLNLTCNWVTGCMVREAGGIELQRK
jgi:hypothetical protein